MAANGYARWSSARWVSARTDSDAAPTNGSSRPAWPVLVAILIGLALLYLAPQVTLVATFALIGGLAGVVVIQRHQRRRQAADGTGAT